MTEALVVFTTFPGADDATRAARVLVEERLAASVDLIPGARSVRLRQGGVADEGVVMALMKTRKQDWAALVSRLHELHPHDVPECVAVRVAAGAPKYMAWLDEVLSAEA